MDLLTHHIDIMLEHVEGPQVYAIRDGARRNSIAALIRARFLLTTPYASRFPTHTILSETGRHFIAKRLAATAEALVRSGCLELDLPIPEDEIYRRVSARQDGVARSFFERRLVADQRESGASQTSPAKSPNRNTSQNPESSSSAIGRCNPEIDNSLRMTSSDDAPASCLAASVNR